MMPRDAFNGAVAVIARRVIVIIALLLVSAGAIAGPSDGVVTGVVAVGDGAAVDGWACIAFSARSVRVEVSVGPFRTARQVVMDGEASGPGPDRAGACTSGSVAKSFRLALSSAMIRRYGGFSVYVTRQPEGHSAPSELAGSGSFMVPDFNPVAAAEPTCGVVDIATLTECVRSAGRVRRLALKADIACTTATTCCGSGNAALIDALRLRGLVIDGNGHTIRRSAAQRQCAALAIRQTSDVLVKNLTFDEDAASPPCELGTADCASTIDVAASKNVRLDGVRVLSGKGYVVKVGQTEGFAFIRSAIVQAGIIGLYVGHYKFGPSRDVVVLNSSFSNARTGGIALQGAYGTATDPVAILGNRLMDNHWHGLWAVPGIKGGITPGGQMLLADGSHIRVAGNVISGAPCGNCNPSTQVSAIEMADVAPAPAGIDGVLIEDNRICYSGGGAAGIRHNPGSIVTGAAIRSNIVSGYRLLDDFAVAVGRAANDVRPVTDTAICRAN